MKLIKYFTIGALMSGLIIFYSCSNNQEEGENKTESIAAENANAGKAGQSAVDDDVSQKNVVKVAIGSPDHTTLVKAVQAGELVDVLSNAGPFTVFAPTNAAFDALPKGTVEDLLKPENKGKLQNILQYHVTVSVFEKERLKDGMKLGMVDDKNSSTVISVKGNDVYVNEAKIIGSVRASNGIIHVIDKVLLPPQ